jgi:hypothetical protein
MSADVGSGAVDDAPTRSARPPTGADELAARLRETPSDEAALARAEARFVTAVQARRARSEVPRGWAFAGAFALAAVAVISLVIARGVPVGEGGADASGTASPTLRAGVAFGGADAVEATLGHATFGTAPGTRAAVASDLPDALEVRLEQGELRVAFHPERRGEEHLAIVTDAVRVEVVGTRFVVRVDPDGGAHVAVSEGVVEVLTRATGARQRVAAGQSVDVPVAGPSAARGETARGPEPSEPVPAGTPRDEDHAAATPAGDVAREAPARVETEPRRPDAPSLPALEEALVALDAGDETLCARLAAGGPLELRLDALEALADHRERGGALEAADQTYGQILALDLRGARGATALFARAALRERSGAGGAADDFARYLEQHPRGALAAQARAHLCALAPERCPAAP